jgi:hypothetical protein
LIWSGKQSAQQAVKLHGLVEPASSLLPHAEQNFLEDMDAPGAGVALLIRGFAQERTFLDKADW